jgi:hypothetical protein
MSFRFHFDLLCRDAGLPAFSPAAETFVEPLECNLASVLSDCSRRRRECTVGRSASCAGMPLAVADVKSSRKHAFETEALRRLSA